ncbi:MAG: hypothetical protein ACYCSJ_09515 [Acidimicrobiales bacterium]
MNETDPLLPDGTYDVMVIDVEDDINSAESESSTLSLVIVTGTLKGQVVTLEQTSDTADPLQLLGSPGRLTVTNRELRLRLEG